MSSNAVCVVGGIQGDPGRQRVRMVQTGTQGLLQRHVVRYVDSRATCPGSASCTIV
jgi:hypothetical protein